MIGCIITAVLAVVAVWIRDRKLKAGNIDLNIKNSLNLNLPAMATYLAISISHAQAVVKS